MRAQNTHLETAEIASCHIFPSAYETPSWHIFHRAYETASCHIFPVLMRPPLVKFFIGISLSLGTGIHSYKFLFYLIGYVHAARPSLKVDYFW